MSVLCFLLDMTYFSGLLHAWCDGTNRLCNFFTLPPSLGVSLVVSKASCEMGQFCNLGSDFCEKSCMRKSCRKPCGRSLSHPTEDPLAWELHLSSDPYLCTSLSHVFRYTLSGCISSWTWPCLAVLISGPDVGPASSLRTCLVTPGLRVTVTAPSLLSFRRCNRSVGHCWPDSGCCLPYHHYWLLAPLSFPCCPAPWHLSVRDLWVSSCHVMAISLSVLLSVWKSQKSVHVLRLHLDKKEENRAVLELISTTGF